MLYIFDNTETLITTLPEGSFFVPVHHDVLNGENTYTFSFPGNQNDAQYIVEGNLVGFKDLDSYWQIFEMKRIVDSHSDGLIRTAYCEHIFYELLDDIVTDKRPSAGATAALSGMLENTRWQIGIVDDLGVSSTTAYYVSALEAVQNVATAWVGELQWRCVVTGGVITRYVDLKAMVGTDTGKQFVYAKDIQSIKREVDSSNVYTAMYGRGKGVETESGEGYGRRLTFADVVWTTAGGKPTNKPAGQEWVGDPAALTQWGRKGRHRYGIYTNEEQTDAAALLQETWDYLQAVNTPSVTYELDVITLEKLTGYEHEKVRKGDLVRVIDREFKPELIVSARVLDIEGDPFQRDPDTKIILGSFAPTIVETTINTQRQVSDIKNKPFNTAWLDGPINALQNAIENTMAYHWETPQGTLYLNAATYAQATEAMLLGGGRFALANQKDGNGGWNWRTFGTGSGYTGDEINAGLVKAQYLQIGNASTFEAGYDPTKGAMGVDSDCTALFHYDGSLNSHKGVTPTFTRDSVAYLSDGTQVAAGQARFEPGKFGKGVMIEEGTTNLLSSALSQTYTGWNTFGPYTGWHTVSVKTSKINIYKGYVKSTILFSMLYQGGLSSFNAVGCVDGNIATTAFHTDTSVPGDYMAVDLGVGNVKAMMKCLVYVSGSNNGIYKVQCSNDGSTWVNASATFSVSGGAGWYGISWPYYNSHRYWRLYLSNTPGPGSYVNEIEWYESVYVDQVTPTHPVSMNLNNEVISGDPYDGTTYVQLEAKAHSTSWMLGGTTRAPEVLSVPCSWGADMGMTISFWVRANISTSEAIRCLISMDNGGDAYRFDLSSSFDKLFFVINGVGTYIPVGLHDGNYHFINVVLDPSAAATKLYLDGVLIFTEAFQSWLSSTLYVGSLVGGYQYNNAFDELRIDKIARTDAEIASWYKANSSFYTSEDMAQLPGCLRAETDGYKVYDSANERRVLMGTWIEDAVREYGIEITKGKLYSSFVKTGTKESKTYIAMEPPNKICTYTDVNGVAVKQMELVDNFLRFYFDGNMIGSTTSSYEPTTGLRLSLLGVSNVDIGLAGNHIYIEGPTSMSDSLAIDDKLTVKSYESSSFEGGLLVTGNLHVTGDMSCTGSKPAQQVTENYGLRYMYATESPEIVYYDRGRAQLENGEATVYLKPIYLECIEPDTDFTPWLFKVEVYGLGEDIRVIEWGDDYFKVKEENGGTSNRKFGWWHEAIRKGYAGIRLMEVLDNE